MKGILEFDLPEDREEYEIAVNGYKYKSVLEELTSFLRQKIKYASDSEDTTHYERIRTELYGFAEDRGVDIF